MAEPADGERWRLFIAVELPAEVRDALQPVIDALQPLGDAVRINPVDRIHLTLHFLGHLPRAQAEALEAPLRDTVGSQDRLELMARGIGAFPNLGRPQVLWAGISGSDRPSLIALQSALGLVLTRAGLAVESRFHPHLTLARVRRPLRGPERTRLRAWVERWREVDLGAFSIQEVTLMRSQLGAGPPRYSRIAAFSLQ